MVFRPALGNLRPRMSASLRETPISCEPGNNNIKHYHHQQQRRRRQRRQRRQHKSKSGMELGAFNGLGSRGHGKKGREGKIHSQQGQQLKSSLWVSSAGGILFSKQTMSRARSNLYQVFGNFSSGGEEASSSPRGSPDSKFRTCRGVPRCLDPSRVWSRVSSWKHRHRISPEF